MNQIDSIPLRKKAAILSERQVKTMSVQSKVIALAVYH